MYFQIYQIIALMPVFLALSGCSLTAIEREPTVPVPVTDAGGNFEVPPQISEDFNRGKAQPDLQARAELDLKLLIDEVVRRNPDLRSMQQTYRAASERENQVTALDDPLLTYGLVPTSFNSDVTDYAQRIELSQKIPWPGKLALRGHVASHMADSAEKNVTALRNKLIEEAKKSFFDYYYTVRALELNAKNISILEEFRSVAEVKYAAGTATKQGALQAEVRYHHLHHQQVLLTRVLSVVKARINLLLNVPPHSHLPPPPATLEQPGSLPAYKLLIELARKHHPELLSLEAEIRAQRATVKLADKEFYPDFIVQAGYNSLWQEEDLRPIVGIGINIPLQQERRRAQKREAQASLSSLKEKYAATNAEIENSVRVALDSINEARHVITLYDTKLLPAARENLAAARSEYQSGAGDFLNFLTAEESYLLALLEFERAQSSYYQYVAQLAQAVGEGFLEQEKTALSVIDSDQEEK